MCPSPLSKLARSWQSATRVGSLLNFYEGVREIVLSVAIKTVFTKDLEIFSTKYFSCSYGVLKILFVRQNNQVWTLLNKISTKMPHLGLQHVNLRLNLTYLAKD